MKTAKFSRTTAEIKAQEKQLLSNEQDLLELGNSYEELKQHRQLLESYNANL